MKFLWRFGIFVLGVGLLFSMLHEVGYANIASTIKNISYPMLGILLTIPLGWRILHSIAFYILNSIPHSSFWQFLKAHIISIAVGDIYPAGQAGGELYRVYYLSKIYPKYKEHLLANLILYNTFYGIAVVLFFLTCIGILFWQLTVLRNLLIVFIFVVLGLLGIIILLITLQQKNIFSRILVFMRKLPFVNSLAFKFLKQSRKVDRGMQGYIRKNKGKFTIFIVLMFLSRFVSVGEIMAIGLALKHPFTLVQAILFELTNSIVQIVLFFVPGGQIGFLEVAINSMGKLTKQPLSITLSLSLLRRFRSLFWNLIGFILMSTSKVPKGVK